MLGAVGVTVIVDRVAAVTVSVVLPETPPKVAVIVVIPAATDVARPALSIVAKTVFEELQVTWDVTSCVVLSLLVPVAVNFRVNRFVIPGVVGVTVGVDGIEGVVV